MTILILRLQKHNLKTVRGILFMPYKGYNKSMGKSLNYENTLICLQIKNTEGKVRNTIARYGLFLNSTSLCSLRGFSFGNALLLSSELPNEKHRKLHRLEEFKNKPYLAIVFRSFPSVYLICKRIKIFP